MKAKSNKCVDNECCCVNVCADIDRCSCGKPEGKNGKYEALAVEIGRLVDEKQAAYGDSFGKSGGVLKILYPDGIRPDQYDDMLCLTRILDKLFRLATDRDALGESPYRDIAGYAILGVGRAEQKI